MFREMKLGRLPHSPARYATVPNIIDHVNAAAIMPMIADTGDYKKAMITPGGMLGNDKYGCCGFAGLGHYIQCVCANLNIPCNITDGTVLGWYGECTGFKPSDPSTDNGVVLMDALQYFMKKGLILGYGRVDETNPAHVAMAIELFGGVYTGWDLPLAWQSATIWSRGPNTTGIWAPGSWGGHCVTGHTYDTFTNSFVDTWNSWVKTMADARPAYCPEMYALILPQWLSAKGQTLQGFDMARLQASLALVK
jgi:hypothetical protein